MFTEEKLKNAVKKLKPIILEKDIYRSVANHHQQTCLSTERSLEIGGRYNIGGKFGVLYVSDKLETAIKEVRYQMEISGKKDIPRVLLSLECRLHRVIDLTVPDSWTALGTSFQELTGDWSHRWLTEDEASPTMLLGQAVYDLNKEAIEQKTTRRKTIEALKVPSARRLNFFNLVIFAEHLDPNSFVEVYDPTGTIQARIP